MVKHLEQSLVFSQVIDRDRIAEFKAQEFKGARSGAATLFTDVLRLKDPSKDQVLEAYLRADDARLKAFKEMKLNYDSLKKLGMSDTQLARIFKVKAGLGNREIFSLRADKYLPYFPSKERLGVARRQGINLPISSLQKLFRNRLGLRLTPEPREVKTPTRNIREFLNLSNLPKRNDQLPQPRPQNLTQAPPTVEMTENRAVNELLRPSPENRQIAAFLGGDPETIIKNMEIARRTG